MSGSGPGAGQVRKKYNGISNKKITGAEGRTALRTAPQPW